MLKGRLEDDRMLTGRGRYVSDWNLPGQAYAHFLRSDRAHAEIVSIESRTALASTGRHRGLHRRGSRSESRCRRRFRPKAAAAWSSSIPEGRRSPRGACASPAMRWRSSSPKARRPRRTRPSSSPWSTATCPPSSTPTEALAPGAPLVHDSVPGNIVLDYESGDEAKTKEAFAKAARVVARRRHFARGRQSHGAARLPCRLPVGPVPPLHVHAGRADHAQPALRGARRAARKDPRDRRGGGRRLRRALQPVPGVLRGALGGAQGSAAR